MLKDNTINKALILLLVAYSSNLLAAQEEVVFCGETSLTAAGNPKSFLDVKYTYLRNPETWESRILVRPTKNNKVKEYEYLVDVGNELVSSIYPFFMGKLGNLIIVKWGLGARVIGVSLIGFDGVSLQEVFRDGGNSGYHILDLDGDYYPEIITFNYDYKKSYEMEVFEHVSLLNFRLRNKTKVSKPQVYKAFELRRSK